MQRRSLAQSSVAALRVTVGHVPGVGSAKQVADFDAAGIVAAGAVVANLMTFGNWTVIIFPDRTMGMLAPVVINHVEVSALALDCQAPIRLANSAREQAGD